MGESKYGQLGRRTSTMTCPSAQLVKEGFLGEEGSGMHGYSLWMVALCSSHETVRIVLLYSAGDEMIRVSSVLALLEMCCHQRLDRENTLIAHFLFCAGSQSNDVCGQVRQTLGLWVE
jgi:hypothetical protein